MEHARRELELAGLMDSDADYGGALAKAALELIGTFSAQHHSGASAGAVLDIFQRLARFQTLSAVTNDAKEWMEVGGGVWQSMRDPSLFSTDAGLTHYSVDDANRTVIKTASRSRP